MRGARCRCGKPDRSNETDLSLRPFFSIRMGKAYLKNSCAPAMRGRAVLGIVTYYVFQTGADSRGR